MPISEAESKVMEVLWQESPRSSEDVVQALASHNDWAEPTIKTLLNRLLNKGAVTAEREGRRYLYSPVLSREMWMQSESKDVVERVFGGRVAPLVAHFSKQKKLSRKDIEDLRALIDSMESGT